MAIGLCVLGRVDYAATVQAMQDYTATRTPESRDLLWICEHDALYTQGIAGKSDHILCPSNIPVVATNRGGQVTFHGPGQVVAYPLIDLQRAGYFVKEYVYRIEAGLVPPASMCAWMTRAATRGCPSGHENASAPLRRSPNLTGWGRLPLWASRSAGTAPTMVWRSISPWTLNPLSASTLAVTQDCARWTFLQSGFKPPGKKPRRCWASSSASVSRLDHHHAAYTP